MKTSILNPEILRIIEEIEDEIGSWEGVNLIMHKYGGIQFNYYDKELGHIHSNGLVDIPLTRKLKELLIFKFMVKEHHTLKGTGWISYLICKYSDKEIVLNLFSESYKLRQKRNFSLNL